MPNIKPLNIKKALLIIFGVLFFISNSLALKPESNYKTTPETYNLPYKSFEIITQDSAEINTWVIGYDSIKYKSTIILVGPDAGNMGYQVPRAMYLFQQGYRVVLFDYRGFGESSLFPINNDQLYYNEFAIDLISVHEEIEDLFPNTNIGYFGLSMGTWICQMATGKKKPNFLIFEGLLINPDLIKKRQKQLRNKNIIIPPINPIVKEAKYKNIPTLLFCGDKDEITTVEDARQYSQVNEKVQLVNFNGGHLQGIPVLQLKYFEEIVTFLDAIP